MKHTDYFISYGSCQLKLPSLKAARLEAKRVSRKTLYPINIVANGDVVESLTPKVTSSGRVQFRTVRPKQFDISITGKLGFYRITAVTPAGDDWCNENVCGFNDSYAVTDSVRMAEDIADGALEAGLRVSVNGQHYTGDSQVA